MENQMQNLIFFHIWRKKHILDLEKKRSGKKSIFWKLWAKHRDNPKKRPGYFPGPVISRHWMCELWAYSSQMVSFLFMHTTVSLYAALHNLGVFNFLSVLTFLVSTFSSPNLIHNVFTTFLNDSEKRNHPVAAKIWYVGVKLIFLFLLLQKLIFAQKTKHRVLYNKYWDMKKTK